MFSVTTTQFSRFAVQAIGESLMMRFISSLLLPLPLALPYLELSLLMSV
jgi:hypothetical protein